MKRFVSCVGVVLGVLGVALCAAGLVGVWVYYPQWTSKTQEIYARLDEALEHAGNRIDLTRERVVTVNAMTADFRASLKEWLTAKQLDRSHVRHRAELIAARLHQVSDGLDFADSFLQKVRSAQRLAHPFRKETETQQIDGLLDELDKLQAHVSGVVDSVERIRQQAAESGDEAQLEATIEQALADVVRVMDAIDSAEDRLQGLSNKVSEARAQAEKLRLQTLEGLWWGRLGACIVLPWMSIGQIALCMIAWRRAADVR